jgi:hypothetical protein
MILTPAFLKEKKLIAIIDHRDFAGPRAARHLENRGSVVGVPVRPEKALDSWIKDLKQEYFNN